MQSVCVCVMAVSAITEHTGRPITTVKRTTEPEPERARVLQQSLPPTLLLPLFQSVRHSAVKCSERAEQNREGPLHGRLNHRSTLGRAPRSRRVHRVRSS